MINQFLACDDTCLWTPEAVDADQSCTTYTQAFSQIWGVLILPAGVTPPADWTSVPDWTAIIDNTATVPDTGRFLAGMGEIAEPEPVTDEYPGLLERIIARRYSLELTVTNMSDTQYAFLRNIQCCGPTAFRFWYYNVSEQLFGGAVGIKPVLVDVSFPVTGDRDDKAFAVLTIDWLAQCDPERADVPGLVDATGGDVNFNVTLFGPADVPDGGNGDAFGPEDVTVDGTDDEAFGFVNP